jgi:hypothetical protein
MTNYIGLGLLLLLAILLVVLAPEHISDAKINEIRWVGATENIILPGEHSEIAVFIYNKYPISLSSTLGFENSRCFKIEGQCKINAPPKEESLYICEVFVLNNSICIGNHEVGLILKDVNGFVFDRETIQIIVPEAV